MDGFASFFGDLVEPYNGNAARHDLLEILLIALCTVLSSDPTAVDRAEFAEAKAEFLRGFLRLENGLPIHGTFSRACRLLEPDQFSACFERFMGKRCSALTCVGDAQRGVCACVRPDWG